MLNHRMFLKNNFLGLLVCCALFIPLRNFGQLARLPINLFELLPIEAHWLIEGEGLLSFDYNGNYRFVIQDEEGRSLKTTEVLCKAGSIEITEIQKSDTNEILINRTSLNELNISEVVHNRRIRNIRWVSNSDRSVLTYETDTIYVYAHSEWKYYTSEPFALFGEGRIKNSIYEGSIKDRKGLCGAYRRYVNSNGNILNYIRERKLLTLVISSSLGYSIHRRKNRITVRNKKYKLKMSSPPAIGDSYECRLRVKEDDEKLWFTEFK